MEFWDAIRNEATEGFRSGETVDDLARVLSVAGVQSLLAVRSLHHLSHVSTLTADFIDYVERFLRDGDRARLASMVVCLRETGRTLFHALDDMSMGLEQLVSSLEDQLMPVLQNQPEGEEDEADDSADRDELTGPTETIRAAVSSKLADTDLAQRLTHPLAQSIADVYAECIQFHREMDRLHELGPDDVEAVMSVLLDLQYSVDVQLRRLLNDDVSMDGGRAYTVGLLNLSAAFLAELDMPAALNKLPHPGPNPVANNPE